MIGPVRRLAALIDTYVWAPATGRPSTAGFWYLSAPAVVTDEPSLLAYRAQRPSPRYLIDYRTRTAWPLVDGEGIVLLPYAEPIGQRRNPEAAFQTALGWHDRYRIEGDAAALERFLAHAELFRRLQTTEGDFEYLFDYHEFKAPWCSALAQARGASVMARAFLITGDTDYRASALRALSKFDVPSGQGGYLHEIGPGLPFYEEYPRFGHYTLNGFMVALMGCWEVARLLDDDRAERLWRAGCETLRSEGARFFTDWWTLYDLDTRGGMANINSPFYHDMIVGYLSILAALGAGDEVVALRNRAIALDRWPNRQLAVLHKAVRKIVFR